MSTLSAVAERAGCNGVPLPAAIFGRTSSGATPLHEAAGGGTGREVVELLSRAGAELDATDVRGRQPIHWAAEAGDVDAAEALLTAAAAKGWATGRLTRAEDKQQRVSPLHLACAGGHYAMAELLLRNGANPRAHDWTKLTPAQWAQRNRHAHLLPLLAKAAGLVVRDGHGSSMMGEVGRAAGASSDFKTASFTQVHGLMWQSQPPPSYEYGEDGEG